MKKLNNLNKVSLKTEYINEFLVDGKKSLSIITPTSSFLKTDIPNKANSREFTGVKNKAVAEMIKTLKTEPEMFRYKNLGIRMVATDFIRQDNDITLFFDNDEGIFNGGHTYQILKTQGRDNAYVNVAVDLNLPKDKLSEISLALNMSKKLEAISVGEKIGAFEWIKNALPEEKIIYKEGDQGLYPVADILKVANLFRLSHGKQYSKTGLGKSLRVAGHIVKDNNANQTLEYTRFIIADMWDVYKAIRTNPTIIKNLPNFVRKDKLMQGISLIMLSGVRYMTEINKNMIPVWKSGYSKEVAIEMCERLSKQISKDSKKAPYKNMKSEAIHRDDNFHTIVQLAFVNELNG